MQQLPKLSFNLIEDLKKSKNLLAFSGGTDSSALFYILDFLHVNFDIALVNYKTRAQSDDEEAYARSLAEKFNKKCYIFTCKLENANFEHNARSKRYAFFEKIISENAYDTLLTAHHLNDRLEWFFMQLSRGAGLVEMMGMSEVEKRDNYTIARPLLSIKKAQIQEFLTLNSLPYFLDKSNQDKSYKRNHIRQTYASAFMDEFADGVKQSFEYLENDAKTLFPKNIKNIKQLYIIDKDTNDLINIRGIDRVVKKLGVLLSSAQREEILRVKECVVSGKIAIVFYEDKIFIAPYCTNTMDKKFKEACRIAHIPTKIRAYMYKEEITPSNLF